MARFWAFALSLVAPLCQTVHANVTCYLLNGDVGTGYLPCDTSADGVSKHTSCCSPADICLASGLCLSTRNSNVGGLIWADSCTDSTFKNEACPQVCVDIDNLPMNKSYINLEPCSRSTDAWCCNYGSSSTVAFAQGIGTMIRQLPSGTGVSSTSITSDSASSLASCTSSSDPTHHADNNTGFIAGITVLGVAFAATAGCLVASLLYIRKLKATGRAYASQLIDQELKTTDHEPNPRELHHEPHYEVEAYSRPLEMDA